MSVARIICRDFQTFVVGRILVPMAFPVIRYVRDQLFLERLDNDALRPSFYARPVTFAVRALAFLGRAFKQEFDDYALRRYKKFVRRHYSKNGRGYFSYDNLSDAEKIALYGEPEGRIRGFIESYSDLLGYQDGDSFFDAGCGRGQNVKVLRELFPNSPVLAKDISAEAISVIDLAAAVPLLTTGTIDLSDPTAFADLEDGAFDHVVISHVFSVLLGNGLEETKRLRQRIVSDLVRVAGKSLLVIDGPDIISDSESFEIEQKDRGWFRGSVYPCFSQADGRIVILQAGISVAILFQPRKGQY